MTELLTAIKFIHQQWQPLTISRESEASWRSSEAFQQYLSFYSLNRFAQARHGFGYVTVADQKIATHYWLPENPRGLLFVLHGYYDHVGLYGNAIEFGLQQQFAVVAFDLPGHGLSEGPRASIDDFGQYTAAFAAVFETAKMLPVNGPTLALAQSTGCSVLLKHQLDLQAQGQDIPVLEGQVLLAPLVRPHGWRFSRIAHWLLRPFVQSIRRVFSANSHDEEFLKFLRADPLQPHLLSVRWVSAMKLWLRQFWLCKSLTVPTLIVQGKEDTTVDWRFNIPVLAARLPNHHIHWIAEGRHQLINERLDIRTEYLIEAARFFDGLCAQYNATRDSDKRAG